MAELSSRTGHVPLLAPLPAFQVESECVSDRILVDACHACGACVNIAATGHSGACLCLHAGFNCLSALSLRCMWTCWCYCLLLGHDLSLGQIGFLSMPALCIDVALNTRAPTSLWVVAALYVQLLASRVS